MSSFLTGGEKGDQSYSYLPPRERLGKRDKQRSDLLTSEDSVHRGIVGANRDYDHGQGKEQELHDDMAVLGKGQQTEHREKDVLRAGSIIL